MKASNVTKTHAKKHEEIIDSMNLTIEIQIRGKATWNFFAFRGCIVKAAEQAFKQGKWTEGKYHRFCNACDHARNYNALRFVTEGFQIKLILPAATLQNINEEEE